MYKFLRLTYIPYIIVNKTNHEDNTNANNKNNTSVIYYFRNADFLWFWYSIWVFGELLWITDQEIGLVPQNNQTLNKKRSLESTQETAHTESI